MQIILATTNVAKIRALGERVGGGIAIVPLPRAANDRPIPSSVEEGVDVAEIARAKAIWYSRHIPHVYLTATDGGLLIPSLGGEWDPVRTARLSSSASEGTARVEALLERARDLTGSGRRTGWTEALAIARDGEPLAQWVGNSPPGELATDLPEDFDPHTSFWVPYVWRCPEYGGRRLSELTEHERLTRRDHWAILGELLTEWARGQTGLIT